ncbi:urate hydroxylase PuuD [Alteromonas gilva]|uniref:Urate hydroxylase PuuD n=1 Tax=Alteromonas gilva TaxID=2987522 RepID=A0ABT5L3K9_9ALTE|nr:urate hydroxylase PuuD [Alteromonas gilva]MDC8831463.1 urate hydroxylase PuuD [Alteromonas gilva]
MPWLDWLSLFVRWFHVIAGVAWIGASFYFIWLDNSLETPPDWKKQKGIKGDLWAVHGGGFYEVGKYAYGPESMPENLHWFKWEAYSTWLSGFALLVIVYYFAAAAYLIDPSVMAMSETEAIIRGLSLLAGGVLVYELACRSPLANYPKVFALALTALLVVASYLATQWFSGRGAYIHVGALIGSIMVANVLLNIMPAQRKMVAAVAAKQPVDPAWGAGAKLRSVHNNYLTLPILFIMISNHYPMTYQHPQNWLVLVAIMALSAWIRHFFNLRHLGRSSPGVLISGALGLLLVALWVSWPQVQPAAQPTISAENTGNTATASHPEPAMTALDKQVYALITRHCQGCHAANPTDEIFKVAPLGVKFDSWEQITRQAPQLVHRTTVTRDMPFLNKTNMTDAERDIIAKWGQQQ